MHYIFNNFISFYFLLSTITNSIKLISPMSTFSAITPLLIVIAINLIREAIEEIRRYITDVRENNLKVKVYKGGKFSKSIWKEIKVVEIIKIHRDEIVPADILVIKSSNKNGNFFLQTTSLDGETNLKQKEALIYTQKYFNKKGAKNIKNLNKLFGFQNNNAFLEIEQPHKNIYKIDGQIILNKNHKFFFDINNTLLREGILKNTQFIYGIVIYTGKDTKIIQNFRKSQTKFAKIDKTLNWIVLINFLARLIYTIIFFNIGIYYQDKYAPNYDENGYNKVKASKDYIYYYRPDKENIRKNILENIRYFTSHYLVSGSLIPTSIIVRKSKMF